MAEPHRVRAAYPGTFDPFTPGHLDVLSRARRLFDGVTVLVAINAAKSSPCPDDRAAAVRAALPPEFTDVKVVAWEGLTSTYCRQHRIDVIIRGVRHARDARQEMELAVMNETLGVTTLLMPARPELATVSSTAIRAQH